MPEILTKIQTGSKEEITLKNQLMKLRRKLSRLMPNQKTKEKSILIIDTDIPRTFAYLDFVQEDRVRL